MKKRNSLALAAIVAAATLFVFGASTVGANGLGHGVWHMLHVGGNDACESFGLEPGCDANFSVSAVQFYDGSVTGQYMDRFAGVNGMHGVVECLYVYGNRAFVAGTTTSEFNEGLAFYSGFEDNGTSANDPADRIAFTFFSENASAQFICDLVAQDPSVIDFIWTDNMNDYSRGQVKIK